jgi:hypothetical protein
VNSETGRYAITFSDSDGDSEGSGVMSFAPSGATTLTATLAGGVKLSGTSTFSPLDQSVDWPFYIPLYGSKGCFIGWMDLGPDDQVTGNFYLITSSGSVVPLTATSQIN